MERFDDWLPHDMCVLLSSMLPFVTRDKARKSGFYLPYTQAESDFIEGHMSYSEERIEMLFTCEATWSDISDKPDGYIYRGASDILEERINEANHLIYGLCHEKEEMEVEKWENALRNMINVMYRLNIPHYRTLKELGLQGYIEKFCHVDMYIAVSSGNVDDIQDIAMRGGIGIHTEVFILTGDV